MKVNIRIAEKSDGNKVTRIISFSRKISKKDMNKILEHIGPADNWSFIPLETFNKLKLSDWKIDEFDVVLFKTARKDKVEDDSLLKSLLQKAATAGG